MPNEKHINKKHLAHLEVVRRQDQILRIVFAIVVLVVLGIVGYGILSGTVLLPYRAVATVNGETITARQFQEYVKLERLRSISQINNYAQYAQMFGVQDPLNDATFGPILKEQLDLLNSTDTMGQKVIDSLIDDTLTRQEAKKRGLTVSADEVDQVMRESFNYFPNGTPTLAASATVFAPPTLNPTQLAIVTITPIPSITPTATPEANITPTLQPTMGPTATAMPTATLVSEQGYQDLLKSRLDEVSKNIGMNETAYRGLIESDLWRKKLLEEVTKDLKPVQEQVWARHILVATFEEAVAVQARLRNGDDFAKVAAEVSTDPGSKDKGGDYGWFARGKMVAAFEEAAFSLKIGEISEPVQTEYGFHIIQVLGHEELPVDENSFQQEKLKAFTDFLAALRKEAQITTYDQFWKTIVPTEPALPTGL